MILALLISSSLVYVKCIHKYILYAGIMLRNGPNLKKK